MEVDIGNVAEAITNLTELGASEPVVKATITLSESGFVSVTDAVAFGEIKDDTIAGERSFCSPFLSRVHQANVLFFVGKLKGFFGGGSSSSSDETTEAENFPPRESKTASTSSAASSSSSGTSSGKNGSGSASTTPEKKVTPVENTIPLTINVKFTSIPPLTVSAKKASRNRYI